LLKIEPLRLVLFVVFGIIILSSCVTNKKIQYLQKDDVNTDQIILDSVIRTYKLRKYEYRIQPHDILSVRIQSLTDEEYDFFSKSSSQIQGGLQGGAIALMGDLVDENGDIEFPVVGKLKVGGLTIFEIQDKIKKMAVEYVDDPIVKVRLLNFRFTILGEVKEEGTTNSFNHKISLPEALGLSGGTSELADRSKIKLIRQYGDSVDIQYINLLDESFVNSPYYYIHQNDILIVPALKQRPFRNYFTQNLGIFLSSITTLLLVFNLVTR